MFCPHRLLDRNQNELSIDKASPGIHCGSLYNRYPGNEEKDEEKRNLYSIFYAISRRAQFSMFGTMGLRVHFHCIIEVVDIPDPRKSY